MPRNLAFTVSTVVYKIVVLAGVFVLFTGCQSERGASTKTERILGKPACIPSCEKQCGNDDGCGGICRCKSGQSCTKNACVVDPACDACASSEACVDGVCTCTPKCADNACKSDGCGGTCPCSDELVLDVNGNSVPLSECKDTCDAVGWGCGELCGKACGTCPQGQSCTNGKCLCIPQCDGRSCRDGCGGVCDCPDGTSCNGGGSCVAVEQCTDTCAATGAACGSVCGKDCGACLEGQTCFENACKDAESCKDCELKLQLVNKRVSNGKLSEVTVIVDYQPSETNPRPRIMDLRIRSNKNAKVTSVELGTALAKANKNLYVDDLTGYKWRERADGSVQFFAFGAANSTTIGSGQLLKIVYETSESGPISFWLVKRAQVFAPLSADQLLQSSNYDSPAVVSP